MNKLHVFKLECKHYYSIPKTKKQKIYITCRTHTGTLSGCEYVWYECIFWTAVYLE